MKRGLVIVAVVVVVVVGLGAAAFLVKKHRADAREALRQHGCADIKRYAPGQVSQRQRLAGRHPALLVVGDSFAQQLGMPDLRKSYPYELGAMLHERVWVDASSGSGYTNPGPCPGVDETYVARVQALPSQRFTVAVVQGGLNDQDADPAQVTSAAETVIGTLVRDGVRSVYLVGPPSAQGSDPGVLSRIDEALRKAADARGARYVSALGWHFSRADDGVHPSVAGERQFASDIAHAIG